MRISLGMRDHFLDHSKALLIFLVVFGHFLERLLGWGNSTSHLLLGIIYSMHMPAFIFISGMLYKDHNYLKNIIFFLSLYLPFQLLLPMIDAGLQGHWQFYFNWQNVFKRPYWILWYLMGMMVWTACTHALIKYRGFACVLSISGALLVGCLTGNNYDYSIGRIVVFFPFFIVGYVYGQTLMQTVRQQSWAGYGALAGLLLIGVVVAVSQLSPYWLYGSVNYTQLQVSHVAGIGIRAGLMLLSSVGIYSLLAMTRYLSPRWGSLGRYTLPVYLLHGLVVLLMVELMTALPAWQQMGIWLKFSIALLLSILSCWVLKQALFDRLLRFLSLWLMAPYAKMTRPKS